MTNVQFFWWSLSFYKTFCLSFGAFRGGQRWIYPSYSGVLVFEFQLNFVQPKRVRGKAEFDIHEFYFGCDGRRRNFWCFTLGWLPLFNLKAGHEPQGIIYE